MPKKEVINKILKKVLKEINPKEDVVKKARPFLKELDEALKKLKINAYAFLGGSTAKNTYLEGDYDIDVFVRFNYEEYKDKEQELSNILEKALKKLPKESSKTLKRQNGSRDYFHIKKDKLFFEIVPVLEINNPELAINITDMSPLHVAYVNKACKKNSELNNEIRLTKRFAKSARVYGAETHISGFSGHIIDLLTIYAGSFLKLLELTKKWSKLELENSSIIIDLEKHHKFPKREISKDKQTSPILLVDPVQPYRNAAAALSKEKLEMFIKAATAFLKEPKESFFEIKKLTPKTIREEQKSKQGKLFVLKFVMEDLGKNVTGAIAMKAYEFILKEAKKNDFKILESKFEYSDKKHEALVFYRFKEEVLEEEKELLGPPTKLKKDVAAFKKKHKNKEVYERGTRLFVKTKRIFLEPKKFIKEIIKEKYVSERVKKIEVF